MASRSRTSFQKRQKELLRMERQREKAAKRMERKQMHKDGHALDSTAVEDEGTPLDTAPTTTE
jgi:hypothetical protein